MALSRYLAHAMFFFTLATGCSQSLFDDGNGGDGNGPPGPMPPDGSPGTPDAGSMPPMPDGSLVGQPDGGGPNEPDGGADSRECPEPCLGDAYADFDEQQGGINARWRYVEVQPDEQYENMSYTQLPDSISGWLGTGSGPPTIVSCSVGATSPPCADLGGSLALTSNAPDGHHPALIWTAETDGVYLVTALWRGSSTASPIETLVRITHDSGPLQSPVDSQEFPLTTMTHRFERDVSLVAGDNIVLSVRPVEDGSVTVSVDLFISSF